MALVESTARIGGLTTAGLSYTDFRTLESTTGAFGDYMDRVEAHSRSRYGADSPQVRDRIVGQHRIYNQGLPCFVQNDPGTGSKLSLARFRAQSRGTCLVR